MTAPRAALGWALLAIALLILAIVLLFPPTKLPRPDVSGPAAEVPRAQAPTLTEPSGAEADVGRAEPAAEGRRLEADLETFTLRVRVVDRKDEPVDAARVILWNKDWSTTNAWTPAHQLDRIIGSLYMGRFFR